MGYEEETKEVEVPPATGIPGYLAMIGRILELSRIQEVVLTTGKLKYRRFRAEGEPEYAIDADLSTLMPSQVVRNAVVSEIPVDVNNAAIAVGRMFATAQMDGFAPVAFVGGTNSAFFSWHAKTSLTVLAKDSVYGLPFLADSGIPSESLLLCAAYSRRSALADTVRVYKITIPIFGRSKS